ncbi:MAG TPA: hypothetical protein VK835_01685 [Bacteroidia bacterium]|jgi:hypothetical protein|nr:hypothetical protein [Bacteroidia bacterium]
MAKKKAAKKKPEKKRASKYEEKLSIKGTLDDVLKVSIKKQQNE